MWLIEVEPKQIWLDESKPKVEVLQVWPNNLEPDKGMSFRVAGCTGRVSSVIEDGVEVGTTISADMELEAQVVTIEGEEYLGWIGEDSYLEELILDKAGYTKKIVV